MTWNKLNAQSDVPLHEYIHKDVYNTQQLRVFDDAQLVEIWCSQGFREVQTHSRTHSQTDRPECSMLPAPFFNGGGGI